MDRLTPDQRHKLLHAVADRRDYFAKLRDRMKATGWPEEDPLFVAVCRAYDAAQAVVQAIYRPEDRTPPQPEWMKHVGP